MNIIKLFDSFNIDSKTEAEVDTYMSRKEAFRKIGGFAKKTALASLPLAAFTAMPQMAFAQTNDVMGVLKFALTLERLEYDFYLQGVRSGIISTKDLDVFTAIREHERIHVQLLEETIGALGGDLNGVPTRFDFTAGGLFPSPFSNYKLFLAVAQAFEDTGVKAYKGQAPNLMSNDQLLTVALQIHSVEARHASRVRRLRHLKGWISENDGIEGFGSTFMQATKPIYANEANVTHAGVFVPKVSKVAEPAIAEAWDEFLTKEQVVGIVTPFIVG
ncbi:ferritin-like domain-containing protein [Pontibacter sp. CAU 1760]